MNSFRFECITFFSLAFVHTKSNLALCRNDDNDDSVICQKMERNSSDGCLKKYQTICFNITLYPPLLITIKFLRADAFCSYRKRVLFFQRNGILYHNFYLYTVDVLRILFHLIANTINHIVHISL